MQVFEMTWNRNFTFICRGPIQCLHPSKCASPSKNGPPTTGRNGTVQSLFSLFPGSLLTSPRYRWPTPRISYCNICDILDEVGGGNLQQEFTLSCLSTGRDRSTSKTFIGEVRILSVLPLPKNWDALHSSFLGTWKDADPDLGHSTSEQVNKVLLNKNPAATVVRKELLDTCGHKVKQRWILEIG